MDSSDAFVMNYESKSLAFLLANKGYDVWLGNSRGNKYSRNHKTLDPEKDKNKFWEFSFHEMGKYDLPAMIKFIQEKTKSTKNEIKKITYVGHSQGTSQLFAGLTLLPEFFENSLNGFIALGPVTSLKYIKSDLLNIMDKLNIIDFMSYLGFREMFPNLEFVTSFQKLVCEKFGVVCSGILQTMSDYSTEDDDMDRFLIYVSHFPSGTSLNCFLHFLQSKRYQPFSSLREMIPYDFTKIPKNIPIGLFVGSDDRLATPEDNRILKKILEEQGVLNYYKEYEKTGHLSFFISISNSFMNDVLQKIDEYSNKN
jgi:pimeloyl-ACP methyl ester carboxylesterase